MLVLRGAERRASAPSRDEWRAGCRAAEASLGTKLSLPIVHRGQVIGFARDGAWRPSTDQERRGGLHCGFSSYVDMKAEWALGKHFRRDFAYGWLNGHPSANPVWYDCFVNSQTLDPPIYGFTGTTLTFKQFDDSNGSALVHGGNVSPDTKHVFRASRSRSGPSSGHGAGVSLLIDRVGMYEACTIANATQTMTNTLTAQRYIGAGQEGLQVLAGCQTTTGATGANFTGHYTNSAGSTAQAFPTTATTLAHMTSTDTPVVGDVLFPVAALDGSGSNLASSPFLPLPSVNMGVQKVEDYIFSAANTGTFYLALVHPLAYVVSDSVAYGDMELLNYHFNLGRIYDGACLSLLIKDAGAPNTMNGMLETVWG